jgi:glutathione S-transferase
MSKSLIIYGRIISPFVASCVLAAQVKGFKYELLTPKGGIKSPAYIKLNPFAKVPGMKDGQFTLYESAVILDYLNAKSKTKRFIPTAAKAAGRTRLVGAIANEYVIWPAINIAKQKRGTATGPVDVDAVLLDLEKGLDALEHVLLKGKFAAGARFSLADMVVAPILLFTTAAADWYGIKDVIGKRPKLKKYWAGIQKHKLVGPVLDDMTAMFEVMKAGNLPTWADAR